ncbi:MAG: FAD-binding oxidoreductase [Saprospiraceae bacterium]|nr:hypothetical protein [Lewinella sp.]MCB0664428.1 hypothetical protein [Saprospiraceae bacterium]
MKKIIKIRSIEHLTHDVLRIVAEKPTGLAFVPGQAADISINKPGWENELRAFTFTALPEDDHLEFTIKTYPAHQGVTAQLLSLHPGDELIVNGIFGDIAYKGEGVFLAGGAGVTPFIAIFKQLEKEGIVGHNKLIFANKTKADIILEEKFTQMLGKNFINILSDEQRTGYEHGFISANLIKKHSTDHTKFFYLCGPPPMMQAIEQQLSTLGVTAENIVKEAF